MKRFILIAALGIFFHEALSQADYAITVKGDTLYGEVKILSYDIIDRVQLTQEKKKKSFTALEVRTIVSNNETYHSIRYENHYKFMKLLRDGYLSLYGFRMDKQFAFDGRYLVKRDGASMDVPNINFKKIMQEFLKDCSTVSEKIKSGELGRKNIDSLIVSYNDCIVQNSKASTKKAIVQPTTETGLPELQGLQEKIEKSSINFKQDVLDLIKDIDTKVKGNQPVPNYLVEGLRGYLVNTEFKEDLDKLIEVIQKR